MWGALWRSINNGNWLWLSASAFFSSYFRVYSPGEDQHASTTVCFMTSTCHACDVACWQGCRPRLTRWCACAVSFGQKYDKVRECMPFSVAMCLHLQIILMSVECFVVGSQLKSELVSLQEGRYIKKFIPQVERCLHS